MKIRRFRPGRGNTGFSFTEILLASFFLVAGLVFMMGLYTSSTRGTTDVYLETMAVSIARETMELVSSLSFEELQTQEVLQDISAKLGWNEYRPVTDLSIPGGTPFPYPDDYRRFERMVQIEPDEKSALVTVKVRLVDDRFTFFRKELITLQWLVVAEYE